jgi:hypothetical protein
MAPDAPLIGGTDILLFRELYVRLSQDVETCFKYIEPTEENMGVYSFELYRLHLEICAAIDSLLHSWYLAKTGHKERNFLDYYPILWEPELNMKENTGRGDLVLRRNSEVRIRPLESWSKEAAPSWWGDHNETKHELSRSTFSRGNLGNVIQSLGALYLLVHDTYTRSTNPVDSRVFVNLI